MSGAKKPDRGAELVELLRARVTTGSGTVKVLHDGGSFVVPFEVLRRAVRRVAEDLGLPSL